MLNADERGPAAVELFCNFESLNLIVTVDIIGIDETMLKSPLSIHVWMRKSHTKCIDVTFIGRGDSLEVEPMSRNPEGRGSIPRLGSRRSSLISIEHAELLRSTPSLMLCCVWLVAMALHVHCGLGQLSPLPTSGDDKWVAAKHCGRAKRSRISNTHRLRSSLQFRYINNQSLLLLYTLWIAHCIILSKT